MTKGFPRIHNRGSWRNGGHEGSFGDGGTSQGQGGPQEKIKVIHKWKVSLKDFKTDDIKGTFIPDLWGLFRPA